MKIKEYIEGFIYRIFMGDIKYTDTGLNISVGFD